MEEDWDIIETTTSSSSSSSSSLPQNSLIGLDFNRFANQPAYNIKDDDNIQDYDQQLIDQGVIFSDESPVLKAQINLNSSIDDVEDMNNELEQQRINQYNKKIIDLNSFFPFIMKEEEENPTRESPLEKTATWQNSTAGSSVPYMSDRIEPIETLPNFGQFGFTLTNTLNQPGKKAEEINKKLNELKLESETPPPPSTSPSPSSQRPIKPIKRKGKVTSAPSPTIQSLPSFAATPKSPLQLTYEVRDRIDVPPKTYIKDPTSMKQNLANCFEFNSDQCQDSILSAVFYGIESVVSDITQWHQLKTLDLSRCNLTSLNHLDTCFPMLEKLTVSHNELKSISGLPDSLLYLHASHNKLCEIDIYQQSRLQHLNLSHNFIQTFQDMKQLKSLRTLDVSNNMIGSCLPFQPLTGLIQLSLKNNIIRKLTGFIPLQELESLDLSFNRIERLESIDVLSNLRELNLDYNNIKYISLDQPMEKLCSLRLSFNRLKSFDVSLFPEVRILFLDDNQIQRMIGATCIARLDSFSLRDQGREKVEYNLQYLRGTRKLYLSGSPFKNMHQLIDFYSLEYLELCSSEIDELPSDFSKRVPNLCHLYLSTNRLQDIRAVKKLKYLRRLILIDNKLLSINEVLSVVKHLKRLNVLDLRQNPMCSNFYPTLSLNTPDLNDNKKVSPYIAAAHDATWTTQVLEFDQQLSDHWRTRREVYRALLIKECPKLKELDHLTVDSSDRDYADITIDNYQQSRASLSL